MSTQNIRDQINGKIESLMGRNAILDPGWITHSVLADHFDTLVKGQNDDFWLICTGRFVRDQVRRALNDLTDISPEKSPDMQMILPGFDHVRKYYPVLRNGVEQHVPVVEMTDRELTDKAEELRIMGRSCIQHADELVRLRNRRIEMTAVA